MSTQTAPVLRQLDALVGEWMMHPSLEGRPTGLGRTQFTWSPERSFLLQHARSEPTEIEVPAEWVANSPFPTHAVIGVDEDSGEFSMLYGDARGVHRVYRMTLTADTWTVWREADGFHQRYIGRFEGGGAVITGGWQSSQDGSTWAADFDLDYRKVT